MLLSSDDDDDIDDDDGCYAINDDDDDDDDKDVDESLWKSVYTPRSSQERILPLMVIMRKHVEINF
jgi:hypothetical protein